MSLTFIYILQTEQFKIINIADLFPKANRNQYSIMDDFTNMLQRVFSLIFITLKTVAVSFNEFLTT